MADHKIPDHNIRDVKIKQLLKLFEWCRSGDDWEMGRHAAGKKQCCKVRQPPGKFSKNFFSKIVPLLKC